jgi:transcription elongation factor GreB
MEIAEITDPSAHYGKDQVFFGCTVAYEDNEGTERSITILGIDEADTLAGQVSWVSPVARALLKARVGDEVSLPTPDGVRVLNVLRVDYPQPASQPTAS